MINSLWYDKDQKNATDTPRIHHQLTPNEIFAEKAVLQVRLSVCLFQSFSDPVAYYWLFIRMFCCISHLHVKVGKRRFV